MLFRSGTGFASITQGDLQVSVLAVVNSVGDVMNSDGTILAGARKSDGTWLGELDPLRTFARGKVAAHSNTILVAIMTNAKLTKVEANRVAQRGHDGMARAVKPAHTSYDGDVVFGLASGVIETNFDLVAEMGADATSQAIRNGVRQATSVDGAQAMRDL